MLFPPAAQVHSWVCDQLVPTTPLNIQVKESGTAFVGLTSNLLAAAAAAAASAAEISSACATSASEKTVIVKNRKNYFILLKLKLYTKNYFIHFVVVSKDL